VSKLAVIDYCKCHRCLNALVTLTKCSRIGVSLILFQVGLDRSEDGLLSDEISKTQTLILDFMKNAVKLPKAAFDLVRFGSYTSNFLGAM
jgi:hypothetical protein